MQELLITLLIGGSVFLLGMFLLRVHMIAWRKHRLDPQIEGQERRHYQLQFRRRMQTSGIISLLGVLLCLATSRIPWGRFPALFTVYVVLLLGLVAWLLMLALGDYLSSQVHNRAALSRIQRKQRELESELESLRRRADGNGSPPPPPPKAV